MYARLRKLIALFLICCFASACSTNGGMYNKDDYQNNQFSVGHTILGVFAVVGVVAAAASGVNAGGGGGYYYEDPRWDYIQSSGQWVCRNATNGQFLYEESCANKPMVDNWPNT